MKKSGTTLLGLMLVFLAFNAAQANIAFTFNSPQDDGSGNIPGAEPFVINIHHDATTLPDTLGYTGGAFVFYLFSDNGTITQVTHRDVDGIGPYESLATSSEWNAVTGSATFMNVFDAVNPGFNGHLPDTGCISFVAFGNLPKSGDHMSLALQVDNAIGGTEGRLCIDSSGKYALVADDWDWLFPVDYGAVTCEGKCWTITGLTPTDVHAIGDTDDLLPSEFGLGQNYPNPFNPSTTFEFALPQRSQVMIEVFNVLGQKVVTLAEGDYAAGIYQVTWNGTDKSGSPVASGIYFYKMQANKYTATKKLLLLK